MRAQKLVALANIEILDEQKLSPGNLADSIAAMTNRQKEIPQILLDGAAMTDQLLTQWITTGILP